MNGLDLLFLIVGVGIIAACIRQMYCNQRADELRARHEDNLRHWRVIDRLEAYTHFDEPAPDFVPADWEQAA